jgi:hypothetical protein
MHTFDQQILRWANADRLLGSALRNTALHRRREASDVWLPHVNMHAALDYHGARAVSFHRDAYDQFRQADDANTRMIVEHLASRRFACVCINDNDDSGVVLPRDQYAAALARLHDGIEAVLPEPSSLELGANGVSPPPLYPSPDTLTTFLRLSTFQWRLTITLLLLLLLVCQPIF